MKLHKNTPRLLISALLLLSLVFSTAALAAPIPPTWPTIRADSAIVMDFTTGEVLFEKNADTMMVPASMTKVMTAYIIFEELAAGNLTLETLVPISEKNARLSRDAANYPASVPLPANTNQSVETLLKLILLPSASASCIVMAEYIAGSEEAFVQRMNETAARLGMTAEYRNCHGAHVHYLTPRAQAILTRDFITRFPQVLAYTSMTSMTFNGVTYANTNHLLPGRAYYYEGADGFKTGTIGAAGYCLTATALRGDHRLISVVMHSDNNATRHTDSKRILDYGFQVLESRSLFPDISYHWSREAVETLANRQVALPAQPGENYLPDQAITRAEFTAMLCSALEGITPQAENTSPRFSDTTGHWAESYINRATALGLVTGVTPDRFSPDTPITRQEIMVLADRFLDLPDQNGLSFADDGDIAFWALESVARVTACGLFGGDQVNHLLPTQAATRGQAAAITLRIMDFTKTN